MTRRLEYCCRFTRDRQGESRSWLSGIIPHSPDGITLLEDVDLLECFLRYQVPEMEFSRLSGETGVDRDLAH